MATQQNYIDSIRNTLPEWKKYNDAQVLQLYQNVNNYTSRYGSFENAFQNQIGVALKPVGYTPVETSMISQATMDAVNKLPAGTIYNDPVFDPNKDAANLPKTQPNTPTVNQPNQTQGGGLNFVTPQQQADAAKVQQFNPTTPSAQQAAITAGVYSLPGQTQPSTYTIQRGDTLSALATKNGTTVAELMRANPQITNANLIQAGATLKLPSKGLTPTSSTIPVPTLTGQSPMQLPPAGVPSTTADSMVAGAGATSEQMSQAQTQYDTQVAKGRESVGNITDQLNSLLGTAGGKGAATLQAEKDAGLVAKQEAINAVNAQITTKMAEFKVLQDKYAEANQATEGKTIPMNLITGQTTERNRKLALEKNTFASEIGLLQATAQNLQGQYDLAKQTADRAVDLKYEDINAQIKIKEAQLELVRDLLDDDEKRQADALTLQYNTAKDKLAIETANTKDKNQTLLNQMQTYPDAGITLTDTLEQANQKIMSKSKIYADKVRPPVGNSGGSPDVKSGGLVIPASAISKGQQTLDNSRGGDGYANTDMYLQMLAAWKKDGGFEQDFFTKYPPKNYLNPNEGAGSILPRYIKDKLKVVSEEDNIFN